MVSRLVVRLGYCSDAGAKEANQDFGDAFVPEDAASLATKGIALALADGISTSAQGREAAELAVSSFLTDYMATPEAWSVPTSAERVIAAINSWLFARNTGGQGPALEDSARERGLVTTFSALVLKGRSAYIFHVGDGRVAHVSDRTCRILTQPHRVDLGGGESLLARALGIDRRVEVDHVQTAIATGDVFVLTSDGVHEHLGDADMQAILAEPDPQRAAEALVAAARTAGSGDNLTAQVLRVEALPEGDLADVIGDGRALPPAPPLMAGQSFEGLTVLRTLHAGHRSHVYLVREEASGRRLVLKAPATEQAGDAHELQRLMLEEWVARRVTNSHLLSAPPPRSERRHAYALFEYLPGQTLEEWAHAQIETDLATVRSLVKQVARGLLALHRREILHCDLRPANVIVDADGTARIVDFGSALVAGLEELGPRAGEALYAGTMQFTAPEIWLGHAPTRASDLWSLGALSYFLLTRSLPYGPRLSTAQTRAAQRKLRYVPASEINPEVPDWMDAALACALALEPAQRYAELSEFTYDLSRPNAALRPVTARPLLARRPERMWQAISALLALALAASWLLGGQIAGRPSLIPSRDVKERER